MSGRIKGSKFQTQPDGTTINVEINDFVEIAVFGVPKMRTGMEGRSFILKSIRSMIKLFDLIFYEEPGSIIFDLFFPLIDRN